MFFLWPNSIFLVCTWWIPHLLSPQQKKIYVEVCQYLIGQVANDTDYLNNVITTNETRIYCYNSMFKQQMIEWVPQGFPCPLKPHNKKLKMKCMVIMFFSWEGLVYVHTMPDVQMVNVDWYVKVLKRLITVHILCKWSHYCNGQWKLHYNNERLYVAQYVRGFLNLTWCGSYSSLFQQHRPHTRWFFPISYR